MAVVAQAAESGATAGAVAVIGSLAGVRAEGAAGYCTLVPRPVPVTTATSFDLASLTKVVTATAALRLIEAGNLSLATTIATCFPSFRSPAVTVAHLLTHSSGLPAWRPLYLDAREREAVIQRICAEPLERAPGEQSVYSDLGFILLGEMVSAAAGLPLDEAVTKLVLAPLGMESTGYRPADPTICAATEHGNQTELQMCGDRAGTFGRWRHGVIIGEANDGNCYYALDGVAGHAGLFGTAADLAELARLWLGARPDLLSDGLRQQAVQVQAPGWGLAWMKPGPGYGAFMGDSATPAAVGHTGFTGTSILVDPSRDLFAVLLTNRLHVPEGTAARIREVRRSFHHAIYEQLEGGEPPG